MKTSINYFNTKKQKLMKKKINKERIWMIALSATALIFFVIGIVKIIGMDYMMASTSLISSLAFSWIAIRFYRGKINFNQPNDGLNIFLPIGFAFTIIGGSGFINAGVWGFGFTLIIVGLLFSPKKNETIEEKNAG